MKTAKRVNYTLHLDMPVEESKNINGYILYTFNLLTRLTQTFDGSKFGVTEQKTAWGRLRSHITTSPFSVGNIFVFDSKADMVAAEEFLKVTLTRLYWNGALREVTPICKDAVTNLLVEWLTKK